MTHCEVADPLLPVPVNQSAARANCKKKKKREAKMNQSAVFSVIHQIKPNKHAHTRGTWAMSGIFALKMRLKI